MRLSLAYSIFQIFIFKIKPSIHNLLIGRNFAQREFAPANFYVVYINW